MNTLPVRRMNLLQPLSVSTQLTLTVVQFSRLLHPREQRFGLSKGRVSSGGATAAAAAAGTQQQAPNTRAVTGLFVSLETCLSPIEAGRKSRGRQEDLQKSRKPSRFHI